MRSDDEKCVGIPKGWQSGLGVLFLLVAGGGLAGCHPAASQDQVCFKGHCFVVETVADDTGRTLGLQGRTTLRDNEGMLFIFTESQPYAFWMKGTLIPLDIVWMDFTRKVVYAESNVPPCQKDPCPNYVPPTEALYVLELKAGTVEKLGIKKGSRLTFRLDKYLAEKF